MSAIDQVERELKDLRSRFSQAFQVLDGFAQLQTHLERLAQTQEELEQSLSQAKERLQASSSPTDLNDLESKLEDRCSQLHSELLDLRHSFEATTYELRDQLHHEQTQIKQLEKFAGTTSGADNNKMDWLENSMQELSNLIYADRSALQHLDRRLKQVKRLTDVLTIVGGCCFFIMTLIIFLTRTRS